MVISSQFWSGRKVFLTGNTGFKGSWLSLWLSELGAEVSGYALSAPTEPSLFQSAHVGKVLANMTHGDICHADMFTEAMQSAEPEIVIHMAAQSLVRESYIDPVRTYASNVMGTMNMLEAVRQSSSVKAVLNITTDKCYENNEWVWGYRENDAMGGHDPYSSSKACAELVSSAYRKSFLLEKNIALATARAGNVIGGGDWATDRIVPDAMRAFISENTLSVRNPLATRPWQHVLEPLAGYLMLCQGLVNQPETYSESWNFGPEDSDVQPVSVLADIMVDNWGEASSWCLDESAHPHEAHSLKLDCSKAKNQIKWKPIWDLQRSLSETVQWYKGWSQKKNMQLLTLQQINRYQEEYLAKA